MEEEIGIRLLTARAAAKELSVPLRQFYRLAKMEGFPKPIVLGPRMHRWRVRDIERWYEEQ